MPRTITHYLPTAREVVVVKIMDEGFNLARAFAGTLAAQARAECPQYPPLENKPLVANHNYVFANGLQFRLFDDGEGAEGNVLEFLVPLQHKLDQQKIFASIPRLLQMAGAEASEVQNLKDALLGSSRSQK